MTQASGSFYYFLNVRKVHDCGREKANQSETTCLKGTVFPISPNGCTNTCAHINTHIHTHTHIHKAVLRSSFSWALNFSSPSKSLFLVREGRPVSLLNSLVPPCRRWGIQKTLFFLNCLCHFNSFIKIL